MQVNVWAELAITAIAVLLGGGGVAALVRSRSFQQSLDSFATTNSEYRESLVFEQQQRSKDREFFLNKLHQQELDCSNQIAELRGQIKTYESGLAERLVAAVVGALNKE